MCSICFFAKAQEAQELIKNREFNLYVSRHRKKLRIFKKMLFSGEGLLNADKRQQIAKTINSAHLQGPKAFC